MDGKYEEGCEFLAKIGSDLHADASEMLKTFLETVKDENNEHLTAFRQNVNEFSGGSTNSFENDLSDFVNSVVKEVEAADIEQQKKV